MTCLYHAAGRRRCAKFAVARSGCCSHGLGAAADWTWRGKLDLVCVMDMVCT